MVTKNMRRSSCARHPGPLLCSPVECRRSFSLFASRGTGRGDSRDTSPYVQNTAPVPKMVRKEMGMAGGWLRQLVRRDSLRRYRRGPRHRPRSSVGICHHLSQTMRQPFQHVVFQPALVSYDALTTQAMPRTIAFRTGAVLLDLLSAGTAIHIRPHFQCGLREERGPIAQRFGLPSGLGSSLVATPRITTILPCAGSCPGSAGDPQRQLGLWLLPSSNPPSDGLPFPR